MLKLFLGSAPLLGGVRRELAAVYREHLFADEAHFVTDQEHFEEELDSFLILERDEIGYCREVRPGVGGEGHKDYVLIAAVGDLSARCDSLGIGVEDDL